MPSADLESIVSCQRIWTANGTESGARDMLPVKGQRIAGDSTLEITARGPISAFVEAAGRYPSRASRAVPD